MTFARHLARPIVAYIIIKGGVPAEYPDGAPICLYHSREEASELVEAGETVIEVRITELLPERIVRHKEW